MRPIAERHGLTLLQLACHWNLAHGPVRVVAPTLIQEPGSVEVDRGQARGARRGRRAERARRADEVASIRAIGDNIGSMALKGAAPDFEGEPLADRWALDAGLTALAGRWGISPERDLRKAA